MKGRVRRGTSCHSRRQRRSLGLITLSPIMSRVSLQKIQWYWKGGKEIYSASYHSQSLTRRRRSLELSSTSRKLSALPTCLKSPFQFYKTTLTGWGEVSHFKLTTMERCKSLGLITSYLAAISLVWSEPKDDTCCVNSNTSRKQSSAQACSRKQDKVSNGPDDVEFWWYG